MASSAPPAGWPIRRRRRGIECNWPVAKRPGLAHHVATREELLWRAGDVLNWIAEGKLKVRIDRTYPLAEAATAHRDLEGRRTAGKLLLTVQAA